MTLASAYCVGIAGGTGSGKTTLARAVSDLLGPETVTVVEADHYYRDLSHLSAAKRHLVNFDHPEALDVDLMAAHIDTLRRGRAVNMHVYDFRTHCRTDTMVTLQPRPIILIEGILVLASHPLACLLDLKVYIDERPEVRRQRRMMRDTSERGRTLAMFSRQYAEHVLPMHERYVEPSRHSADIILTDSTDTDRLLPLLRKALSRNPDSIHNGHRER